MGRKSGDVGMFEKKKLGKILGLELAYDIIQIVERANDGVFCCSTMARKNKFYKRIIDAAEHGVDFSNVNNIHQLIVKVVCYEAG